MAYKYNSPLRINTSINSNDESYDNVPGSVYATPGTPNQSFLHSGSPKLDRNWRQPQPPPPPPRYSGYMPYKRNRPQPVQEPKIAKIYGTYKLLNRFITKCDYPGLTVFKVSCIGTYKLFLFSR
uniref:Uncharacterized protein n=1 Tax=Cacopsylla melanoneura TaxID=428564 RepID=A0A8D8VN89_9HEMI